MNAHLYEQKRNELIALLDGALKVNDLPLEHVQKIRHARTKALKNQFVVVLVGEFQGGKSTSFNALCDGSEISPRGIGIKTSACVMAGMNISDSDERERAEIEWKSPRDLLLSFVEVIEDKLRVGQPERFSI
jgi:septin family protein